MEEKERSYEGENGTSIHDEIELEKIGALSDNSYNGGTTHGEPPSQLDAASGNDISFRAVAPVDVQVRNLAVSVQIGPAGAVAPLERLFKHGHDAASTTKVILDDISANMPSGSLTAIIGGSGSGKTSMLNIMAHRMRGARLTVCGTSTYNGRTALASVGSAYVMQQDVLMPTLTVRETLRYAADLRLVDTPTDERRRVVEEVILELGLKECADTRIGNNVHKGCSGGEKRRVSIGVQLLANPSVLFLDEPTTGLDATSAFWLVRTMKNLARKGRTVITTIHQPRSEIWSLFDHLVLLTRGSAVYSGPAGDCLAYFDGLGFKLPAFVNPAEFLIDVAAVDTRSEELETASSERVEQLKSAWRGRAAEVFSAKQEIDTSGGENKTRSDQMKMKSAAATRQIRVLTARTFKVTCRDPFGMARSIFEAVVMGIMTGWIFINLGSDIAGIRSREGAIYAASALQGYLILLFETYRMTIDIEVFDRERGEGVVTPLSFLISRRLARFFIEDLPVPFLFSVIFYFMAGFRREAGQFFTFFGIILLTHYIAVNFATLCVATSRHFAGASLIANMGYTLQSMACGYFVNANQIAIWLRWTKWTAYVFYAFGALCANEFVGHFYDCPYPGGPSNPACLQYTGAYIMSTLGLPSNWLVRPIIVMLAFAIAFYIGAGLILQFWKTDIQISGARQTDTDYSAGKEKMTARSRHELRTVTIGLDRYTMDIEKRSVLRRKKRQDLSILQPISTKFEPGVLNVIMGPSGSGKTTLLNAMARRLHSTVSTRYRPGGDMLVNGAVASESVIRSICSFVPQDDEGLYPALTVRETLRFAAGLRLPKWMSKEEKNQRAESIMLKMGLKDCADNYIGSDLVKGISGGEKRRVTIAVQILTEPRVLMLDEPTSGLDAFTASSIIDVLRGLADEGRTLILTIHQSRSDLFHHFGNVLLLARGGSPVYAGPGSAMLPHFASLGYNCPSTTNPADFALDLITVDLQQASKEASSRAKVAQIISAWHDTAWHDTTSSTAALAPTRSPTVSTPAELGSLARSKAGFRTAFPILVARGALNLRRQPDLILARIMQVAGLGIVLTVFFAPLQSDYAAVQSRLGFVQQFSTPYYVGMLQNIAAYPADRAVFYREHDDAAYPLSAFFLAYWCLEAPFEIASSLLFAALTVLGAGLDRTPTLFFVAAYNVFCIVSCGESLGIMFLTLFAHTGFAVAVMSVVLAIPTLMGGIISLDVDSFLQALNHLSPVKWAVGNLAVYALRDASFYCTPAEQLADGSCPITSGLQALQLYKLDVNPRLYVMALGLVTIAYRALAYGVLRVKRERWGEVLERGRRRKVGQS